ncbi:MAG TPA: choice-of-anchor tandem repeat GloVer-containing protein [Rhizomicrobium sp.]
MQHFVKTSLALLAMLAAIVPVAAHAAREKLIYSFTGNEGVYPDSELLRDAQGNFYGTASGGGSSNCLGGCGTVFKVTPRGKEITVHAFTGDDGGYPYGQLIADSAGNLYGTAERGGKHIAGTVFRIAPDGTTTVIHHFNGSDGSRPDAGLIFDHRGDLFGTTSRGGANGFGTVFEIRRAGKEKLLYSFAGGTDGAFPLSTLLRDSAGNLYGTTSQGGIDCDGTGQGCGTVFKLGPDGIETVLYRFKGGNHGANPIAGLVKDDAGALYGTTRTGGIDCNGSGDTCGTVFRVDAGGKETVLHTFAGGSDGAYPRGRLLIDANGNLFGTTPAGGAGGGECGCGIVFKLTSNGAEKILHTFISGDGHGPFAGLIQDPLGNFYGTTDVGGAYSWGTVFKVRHR